MQNIEVLKSLQERLNFILQIMKSVWRFSQVSDVSRFRLLTNHPAALCRLDLGIEKGNLAELDQDSDQSY